MTIRLFHPDDAFSASALITRCLREVNSHDYTPGQVKRLCGEFTPDRVRERFGACSSFVAVQGDVVGTATLRENELGSVFVRPDVQGQGVDKLCGIAYLAYPYYERPNLPSQMGMT